MPYNPFAAEIETTLEIRANGICIAEVDCTLHLIEDAETIYSVEAIQIEELGGEKSLVMTSRDPKTSLFWHFLEQCSEKSNRDHLEASFLQAAAEASYQLEAA